jgi:tRNA U34 5-carboxymethylaminomethyl modifying enzyme MnmG/GidA
MHANDVPDTAMARLVRIETKLSVFMQTAQHQFNELHTKVDTLQRSLDEIYVEEDETWDTKSST